MPSVAALSASPASPLRARPRSAASSSAASFPPLTFLPPSVRSSSFLGQGLSASLPSLDVSQWRSARSGVFARAATGKSLHDYTVKDIDGKDVSLSKFKGKLLLIVNVASKCGLTQSNYSELSHLYEKYKPQGEIVFVMPSHVRTSNYLFVPAHVFKYVSKEDAESYLVNKACRSWHPLFK